MRFERAVQVVNVFGYNGREILLRSVLRGITVSENQVEDVKEFRIRLKWGSSEAIDTIYANHLFVTHAGGEFYLVFGELEPVFEIDRDNPPEYLEITPVAKIAVAPESMVKFAEAIEENIAKYMKSKEQ